MAYLPGGAGRVRANPLGAGDVRHLTHPGSAPATNRRVWRRTAPPMAPEGWGGSPQVGTREQAVPLSPQHRWQDEGDSGPTVTVLCRTASPGCLSCEQGAQ